MRIYSRLTAHDYKVCAVSFCRLIGLLQLIQTFIFLGELLL